MSFRWLLFLALALPAVPLPGQIVAPAIPNPPNPWMSPVAPRQMPGINPIYQRGFQGLDSTVPEFQGFPTFPPSAEGYGGFPRPPESLVMLPDFPEGRLPPPAPEPRDAWPSWIRLELEAGTGAFAPSRAVMVRASDQVWLRAPEETAFLPLAYFDTVRVLEGGSQIEVRNQGEFQIGFHGGSRMLSHGPIGMRINELSEQRIALDMNHVTRVNFDSRTHPLELQLPDGSVVEANQDGRGADLFVLREMSRVFVHNWGPGVVRHVSPLYPNGIEVIPGHRLTVWLAPYEGPVLAADLSLEGTVSTSEDQRRLQADGGSSGGAVVWSGTRIRVPAGATLSIDPLSGTSFPAGGDRDR